MTTLHPFVHLRMHTEFSVVDGAVRVPDAIKAATENNQPALAITDLNNLFGAVKFYKKSRAAGVKPLIGADINVIGMPQDGEAHSPLPGQLPVLSRLLILVQNNQGYLNLCELLARAWTQGSGRDQAAVHWTWLQELNEGLIVLSGAQAGACRSCPDGGRPHAGKPVGALPCRDLYAPFLFGDSARRS